MITVTSAELNAWLATLLWPLARILAVVSSAPLLGNQRLQAAVKIGLGLLITAAVVPTLGPLPPIDPASGAGLLVLANQVAIGLAMGFAMQLVFTAVEAAGDYAGLQMGIGFAIFYDPQSAGQTPVLGQFLGVLATLVFLALDGHLMIVSVLAESFRTLPVAGNALSAFGWNAVAGFGARIFLAGLFLALPLVVTLLIVNLALGVLTRAAPQLNLFAIGFPVMLAIGLLLLTAALPQWAPQFERLVEDGLSMMAGVAGTPQSR